MTTGWLLLISLFISEINYLSILQMLDSLLNECVHQDFHNRSQCWFLWAVSQLLWNGNQLLSQQFFSFFFFSALHLVPELWRENHPSFSCEIVCLGSLHSVDPWSWGWLPQMPWAGTWRAFSSWIFWKCICILILSHFLCEQCFLWGYLG